MKRLPLFSLLLLANVLPLQASKPDPDPALYTQIAHVIGSADGQRVVAVIDGVQYSMVWHYGGGLLQLGDYPARKLPSAKLSPKTHAAYDVWPAFELLMPDKSTREYDVTAMGNWIEPASTTEAPASTAH